MSLQLQLQRNPIAGGVNSYKPNTLWSNGFAIATSSKAQSQDSLTYYAGETGGSQYIIYSTKDAQSEAYPGGSSDYTPVAWGSFDSTNPTKLLELINGLPGRPGGAQYGTIGAAMNWLNNSAEYFIMNQDYPFVQIDSPLVIWDPSIPQCSCLGLVNSKTTNNLGNSNLNGFPSTFAPEDSNSIDFGANGGTAYGAFQSNTSSPNGAMKSTTLDISNAYTGTNGFMISVWFKHSNISGIITPCSLFSFGNYTSTGLILAINGSHVSFGNAADYASLPKFTHSFSNNQWNNVTLVLDNSLGGSEFTLWINGSSEGSQTKNSFNWSIPEEIYIGGNKLGNGVSYNDPNLVIGNTIIDHLNSQPFINYNYLAYKAANGINGKY